MKKVLVRGKFESLTLSDGQYYCENIFPQSKELAAEMAQIPLLSMLVPTRVFVQRNNICLNEVHVDLDNVPSQIISAHSKQTMSKFRSQILGYTIKYNPLPSGVPSGFALRNSFRQRVIFDRISLVSS